MTHPAPTPDPVPSQDDLWRRHQLALSLLDQRGPTATTAVLVRRVLDGEHIDTLRVAAA